MAVIVGIPMNFALQQTPDDLCAWIEDFSEVRRQINEATEAEMKRK